MIDGRLKAYWTLCFVYRRAVDITDRKNALFGLKELANQMPRKYLRFVDLNPKVQVRLKGESECGPES